MSNLSASNWLRGSKLDQPEVLQTFLSRLEKPKSSEPAKESGEVQNPSGTALVDRTNNNLPKIQVTDLSETSKHSSNEGGAPVEKIGSQPTNNPQHEGSEKPTSSNPQVLKFGSAMETSRFFKQPSYLQSKYNFEAPNIVPSNNAPSKKAKKSPTGFERVSRSEYARLRAEAIDKRIMENQMNAKSTTLTTQNPPETMKEIQELPKVVSNKIMETKDVAKPEKDTKVDVKEKVPIVKDTTTRIQASKHDKDVPKKSFKNPTVKIVNTSPYRVTSDVKTNKIEENGADLSVSFVRIIAVPKIYTVDNLMDLALGNPNEKRKVSLVTLSLDAAGIRTADFKMELLKDAVSFQNQLENEPDFKNCKVAYVDSHTADTM